MRSPRRAPDREDDDGMRRLQFGFVALVGASGGLTALQVDASPALVGLGTLGGVVTGAVLLWYLRWIAG